MLSSFLDNAPTYLSFTALAQGVLGVQGDLNTIIQHSKYGESLLIAISLGAVFMGANSYIGNAPNFMVKNITEKRGIKMPSFGGYLLWSGGILIPLFVVINWLFL
jgi:Na+/H+ antiporter NhaD/arsenite permease-like protein